MTYTALIRRHIGNWDMSHLRESELEPWHLVSELETLIRRARAGLSEAYVELGDFKIHSSATIEQGVVLKGAGIIGPRCYVAAGAYLRGEFFSVKIAS